MSFSELIASWETFYLLLGTAAATLIGLLFVAVSINIDLFRKKAYLDMQYFATLTFNSFFYVLVIALLFLIPGPTRLGLGLPLLFLGLLGFGNTILQSRRARRIQAGRKGGGVPIRFTIAAVSLIGLALAGLGFILGIQTGLNLLVVVLILLLGSAAVNAWSLLVTGEPEASDTDEE